MTLTYQRKRLADFAAGARLSRELAERERWPRERLARFQQQRLDELVRHAVAALALLPRADPPTDRPGRAGPAADAREGDDDGALRRARDRPAPAPRRAARPRRSVDRRRPAPGPLPRDDHQRVLGPQGPVRLRPPGMARADRTVPALQRDGRRPPAAAAPAARGRARRRLAVAHEQAHHADRRLGLHRVLSLPVTLPLTRLVEQLNGFQPQFINAYPSLAVLLAEEQLAGRLRIAPSACPPAASCARRR